MIPKSKYYFELKRLQISLLFLLTLPALSFSQDITGTWEGKLTQTNGGFSESYGFAMDINVKGTSVFGLSKAWFLNNPATRVEMTFNGEFVASYFNFKENRITYESDIGMWQWCLKSMTLKLEVKEEALEFTGKWWGTGLTPDCPPGKVFLSKPLPPKPKVDSVAVDTLREVMVDIPDEIIVEIPKDTIVEVQKPVLDTLIITKIDSVIKPPSEQRRIVVEKTIAIPVKEITIYVWDSDEVDGDRVTLFFNGMEILTDYKLTKEKKQVALKIQEGLENMLVLHAVNEGKKKLNTAAISWWQNGKFLTYTLHSDMNQSGALKFGQ